MTSEEMSKFIKNYENIKRIRERINDLEEKIKMLQSKKRN